MRRVDSLKSMLDAITNIIKRHCIMNIRCIYIYIYVNNLSTLM